MRAWMVCLGVVVGCSAGPDLRPPGAFEGDTGIARPCDSARTELRPVSWPEALVVGEALGDDVGRWFSGEEPWEVAPGDRIEVVVRVGEVVARAGDDVLGRATDVDTREGPVTLVGDMPAGVEVRFEASCEGPAGEVSLRAPEVVASPDAAALDGLTLDHGEAVRRDGVAGGATSAASRVWGDTRLVLAGDGSVVVTAAREAEGGELAPSGLVADGAQTAGTWVTDGSDVVIRGVRSLRLSDALPASEGRFELRGPLRADGRGLAFPTVSVELPVASLVGDPPSEAQVCAGAEVLGLGCAPCEEGGGSCVVGVGPAWGRVP